MTIHGYDEKLQAQGIDIRKELFGAAHTERSLATIDDFNDEFQQLLNQYCFTEIWGRDGLPRQMRSVITMSILIALNRSTELRLHVRAALRNGLTRDEIKEVFLQATVYCGIPAGVEAFRAAREVFAEIDQAST